MAAIDPRIVQVGIEVNGQLKLYEGLEITASGTKYGNAIQNECEVKISNLDKTTRDFIATETSPFNRNKTPKRLVINAGRVSYGTTRIFSGNISSCKITQPPDIGVTLKCLTGNYLKGNLISKSQGKTASLSDICRQVSQDLSTALTFEAADKKIVNYFFSGGALKQVNQLQNIGGIDAFIDDETLIVKNLNAPLAGKLKVLSQNTGMIGIPELTEHGVKVKFLLDNQTVLGGALQIQSQLNPAANGVYTIYKLGFEIASRDTPFYWIAEGKRR